MPIILSPALVVSPSLEYEATDPVICWSNKVNIGNIVADSEAANYPVTNLGNTSTTNKWKSGSTLEQLITVSNLSDQSNCVAIARHNLGSTGATVSVEAITAEPGAVWEVVHAGVVPATDSPLVLVYVRDFYVGTRVRIVPDGVAPEMAVLFVSDTLVVPESVQSGYTPVTDSIENTLVTGWSDSGEFLGSIVHGSVARNRAEFRVIDFDWYADNMRDFILYGNNGNPFFFVRNPQDYPDEVSYSVFSSMVKPSINYPGGGQVDFTIPMNSVAL